MIVYGRIKIPRRSDARQVRAKPTLGTPGRMVARILQGRSCTRVSLTVLLGLAAPARASAGLSTQTAPFSYYPDNVHHTMTNPAGASSATYLDNGWQLSRGLPNGATTFNYDTKDRLTQESSTRVAGYSQSYTFDASGNPTGFKGVSQSFNTDNQQTSNGTFVYDGMGNPTTYRGTSMAYDPTYRIVGIGSQWSASYRADGLRGWKSLSGSKTYYIYDGSEPVLELDGSGSLKAVNVFAPDGLVAREESNAWTHYVFDPQGNAAQRLNSDQSVQSSSVYDAYGTESSSGSHDTFGYNARWGQVLDRETGIYVSQNRSYDPATGRTINRDHLGLADNPNLYCPDSVTPTEFVGANAAGSTAYAWKDQVRSGAMSDVVGAARIDTMDFPLESPSSPAPDALIMPGLVCLQSNPFTNAECKAACAGLRKALRAGCVKICTTLHGKSCQQLWNLCAHIMRHGTKQEIEGCEALNDALCAGD